MFARKIDSLGRIVLPAGALSLADINKTEYVYLSAERNKIIIEKAKFRCTFCGAHENLRTYKKHFVCTKCMNEISKLKPKKTDSYKCVILFPPL